MSMFLGPIHYMMYNKINIAADRARTIINTFKEKFPAETEETVKAALPEGPVDFGGRPLDEILGDNPIHQFLQGLIDAVEVSEATLVTALLYRFPEEGKAMLEGAFKAHGAETAQKALGGANGQGKDLNAVVNLLSQNYLEGMPCDPGGSYVMEDDHTLEVQHSDCLHRDKWEHAGAPVELMCGLLDKWVEGFAQAMNPGVKLERESAQVKGASTCKCKLTV